jgi:hypothetical protein
MRFSEPPVVATWLLDHFGPGPGNDAILGDLIEQYRSGRPRAWYWQQVITAIAVGAWKEIASHKLLACRAFVIMWGILFFAVTMIRRTIITLDPNSATIYQFFSALHHQDWWLYYSEIFRSSLFLFLLPLLAQFAAAAFSAWISARLHRPVERALILAWLASWGIVMLPVFSFVAITDGPVQLRGLMIAILWNCMTISGVLAGGLYSSTRRMRAMAPTINR